jgi:cytochrome c-type biogenesis protein CcmH
MEEAQGIVSPGARAAFAEALRRNPAQPQARYFVGLAKLQAGDSQGALADWRALLADAPADAVWRAGLADQVNRLAADLSAEPAEPGDSAARQAMIESMVAGLAARLEAARDSGGGTAREWAQLGRSYRVLGRPAPARDAYAEAVKRAPDDMALWRDYAAAVAEADGERSEAHIAALRQWRDRLPEGSPERAAIDAQMAR